LNNKQKEKLKAEESVAALGSLSAKALAAAEAPQLPAFCRKPLR